MSMKYLKLRKDYPEWDWNGDDKRKKAYLAMTNKENTSLFAKKVWNDMVDCLNDALEEVGLQWNDYVASLTNTKFNVWFIFDLIPQTFTARMFNSVKYNIEKLMNQTFIWEYDKDYEGYVGRSNYRGVNEANEPDTLYGSAIIELARKINLVIQVLKDEALTKNESANVSTKATTEADLALPELEEIGSSIESSFSMSGTISETTTKRFNAKSGVNSSGSGKITLKNARSTFNVNIHNFSYYDAALTLEELYRNLYSTIFHYSITNAKLVIDYRGLYARVQIPNYMLNESRLTFADILEMLTRTEAVQSNDATILCEEPLNIHVREIAGIITDVLLANAPEKKLLVDFNGFSSITCKMENFKGSTFLSLVAHKENDRSKLSQAVCRRATSQITSRATVSIPQLIRAITSPVFSEIIEHVSQIDGMLTEPVAKCLNGTTGSELNTDAEVNEAPVSRMSVRSSAFDVDINTNLEAVLIRVLEINKRYQAEFNTHLLAVDRMLASGSATSSFSSNIRLELFTTSDSFIVRESFGAGYDIRLEALNYDNYPIVDSLYESLFDAELDGIEPFPVRIDEIFHTESDSIMRTLDASETANINAEAFKETIETSMSIVNLGYMSLDVKHDAHLFADISFDPASWLNPVQTEKDLEIYQVFGSELKNKNLYLE